MYKKVQCGYIVINKENKTHTHIQSHKTATGFIRNLNRGVLPKSKYLQQSAKKILTQQEYEGLKGYNKQKYINIQKGCKK